jgi:hypothetical protein
MDSGGAMISRNGRYCIDVTKTGLASSSGINFERYLRNDGKNFSDGNQ